MPNFTPCAPTGEHQVNARDNIVGTHTRDLPMQDRDFMPQDQDLRFLGGVAADQERHDEPGLGPARQDQMPI